jgi:hypothetical protein
MKRCKKIDYYPIGIQVEVGAPAGVGVDLVGKPVKFLQFELGGTTTLTGGGVKAGAMLFLPWYVSPGISIEGGKNWAGDLNRVPAMFGSSNPHNSLLDNVQYDYCSFLGSLGFGSPRYFMFRVYVGESVITGTTHGLREYFYDHTSSNGTITIKEANAIIWSPTAKISFTAYF